MEIMDGLKLTLQRNMLKWHVGQVIFCPGCQVIMDCKRAVEIDFYGAGNEDDGEELIKSKIVCASCYDSRLKGNLSIPNVRVEAIDGRVLFARPKKAKRIDPEVHAV